MTFLLFERIQRHGPEAVRDPSFGEFFEHQRRVEGLPFLKRVCAWAENNERDPVSDPRLELYAFLYDRHRVPLEFATDEFAAMMVNETQRHRAERDVHCAPVAMLSAAPAICPDALPRFRGKHVRIFPHAEQAGLQGAARWEHQLMEVGAATVDGKSARSAHRK